MASSSNIRAGRAYVELGADSNAFIKALKRGEDAFVKFGKNVAKIGATIGAAGAAITGALTVAVHTFADMGDHLAKASKRTGIAVEALSALKFAAGQSAVEFDTLLLSIARMQKSIAGVADEAEGTTGKLDKLGISASDLAGLSPDQQFLKIADAIAAIQDPAKKTAAAMSIFGRGGAALLPLFSEGARGIRSLMKEANDLGIVMSTEDAGAAEKFDDALKRLWTQVKVVTFTIGGAVANALLPFQQAVNVAGRTVIDLAKAHSHLAVTAGIVGVALTIVGTAMSTFGIAMIGVGKTLGIIAAIMGVLLTPMGLLSTVVIGAAGAFFFLSDAGNKALSYLGRQFAETRNTAQQAFDGIADALRAGDITTAGQIVVTELKIAWVELKGTLTGIFDAIGQHFVSMWEEAIGETQRILIGFQNFMQSRVAPTLAKVLENFDVERLALNADGGKKAPTLTEITAEGAAKGDKKAIEQLKQLEKEINDKRSERDAARMKQATEESAAMQKQLDALKTKMAELRGRVQGEGVGTPSEAPPSFTPPTFNTDEISKGMEKAMNESTRGLFNISGLQGLQGTQNNFARDTAKNTKDTSEAVSALAQAMRSGGMIYSY